MIESIIKGFDVWTDAQGVKSKGRVKGIDNISLEGIVRLRELIIKLGICGKLVPQDSSDESAHILLEKIRLERKLLLDQGRIRKEKDLPEVEDENHRETPNNWAKERLGNLFNVVYGSGISTAELTTEGYEVFGANGIIGKYKSFNYEKPQLLVSCRGAYSGKPNISPPNCFVTSNSLVLQNRWEFLDMMYYFYQLSAFDRSKIITGSAQPQVTTKNLDLVILNIPPLSEQKRIVAKIGELLRLCDYLEEEQTKNLSTHHNLVKSLLDTLTQANDADELQSAWEKLAEYFDTLFCTEDSIEQLKEIIIQLALRGKLTKQDLKDGNAIDLKHKIFLDFERLAKEGTAKKPVIAAEINEEEMPYSLPINWAWVRLQEIIQISSGDGLTASNMNSNGEIPVYGGNGVNGYHDKYNVTKPTLVIGRVGFYCGSIHITPANAWVTDNAFITTFSEDKISIDFLYWLLKGTNLKENDNATAQPVISGRKIYPIIVGLPPINEQKKIVEKIVSLYTICDSLMSKIEKSQKVKELLSQTVTALAI